MDIKQLIARRSDLSTFLVHLTRDYEGAKAKENLKSILNDRVIEARNPYGSAVSRLSKLTAQTPTNLNTQKVVCFTETPLEHVHLLAGQIEWRRFELGPYGIAITKRDARTWDVNPVWYLDITPARNWLTKPLERLINTEIRNKTFATSDIAKLTPFIEQMGTCTTEGKQYFKEYWWEREWRHVGNFSLPARFIVVCPEEEYDEVTNSPLPKMRFIDPDWSLEQIIGRLADFESEHIDPF